MILRTFGKTPGGGGGGRQRQLQAAAVAAESSPLKIHVAARHFRYSQWQKEQHQGSGGQHQRGYGHSPHGGVNNTFGCLLPPRRVECLLSEVRRSPSLRASSHPGC